VTTLASAVAPASAAETWERWADIEAWPAWNPVCVAATVKGPLAPGTRLELCLRHPRGREFWTKPRLTVVEPRRELSWQARGLGFRAVTRTTLEDTDEGTRITASGDTGGPLAFTYRLAMSEPVHRNLLADMLDALAADLARAA
jgi:hypothetical protein